MVRAGGENFPVALRVLPRTLRTRLLSIYGFARLVDQLGDDVGGDRRAALDALEADVDRIYRGEAPRHDAIARLPGTIRACGIPRGPFDRLIAANRRDQEVARYETWEQLDAYCDLSANPVGELVLHVLGAATPERIALSDRICTALQLAEHWQDVREDVVLRDRVYLPAVELRRFGVTEEELRADRASPALRALMEAAVARARALLDEGRPLVGTLSGWGRLAVAGYVGGGYATLDAIEAAGYDPLPGPPKATPRAMLRAAWLVRRG
jgi:squalene synthase HpnC